MAKALSMEKVYGFGLSEPYEAYLLRKAGFIHPILLLSGFEKDWLPEMYNLRITPVVTCVRTLEWLADFSYRRGIKWDFHLKLDTGMHRFGMTEEEVPRIINLLKENPQLNLTGIMTHLSCAERPEDPLTRRQVENFFSILETFNQKGIRPKFIHLANSAGIIFLKERGNLVRPGISLFGSYPSFKARSYVKLFPVMSVKSRVVEIKKLRPGEIAGYGPTFKASKKCLLGIVPVGYGDGYPRSLSNKGFAWIRGKRVPVVGTVSMKCLYLDLTEIEGVEVGEEVILLGGKHEEVPADELANLANTISYELFCNLGRAIPKHYKE